MATNNSRFLAINANTPYDLGGWQVRILDYKDMTSVVSICNQFDSFQFTEQLNDPGTGSITIDTDNPWWDLRLNNGLLSRTVLDHEYVFELWENGHPRFAFLGQTVTNTIIGDDETHKTTISGPGIAQTLTWACIMRPGWPKAPPIVSRSAAGKPIPRSHSYQDTKPAFLWQFPQAWTSMRMWTTVFAAAQRRGLLRFVKPQFSGIYDTARQKWKYVKTLQTIVDQHGYQPQELNENLLDFLNECTGQDYTKYFGQRSEWIMKPGFKLICQPIIGTDKSATVRWFAGQILSNERTRDRESIFNRVTAVDVDGIESIQTDAASINNWNLREQRNETNKNITDPTLRNDLALRYIQQFNDEKSQWTIKVPYDEPRRQPFVHFNVGDWVMIANASDNTQLGRYRVKAISVSLAVDQSVPDLELTLQSIIDTKTDQLQKQITEIVNAPRNFSLHEIKDIAIPAAPSVDSALTYNPATGKWEATPISDMGGGSTHVYIQDSDPAATTPNTVTTGDFWVDTSVSGG